MDPQKIIDLVVKAGYEVDISESSKHYFVFVSSEVSFTLPKVGEVLASILAKIRSLLGI